MRRLYNRIPDMKAGSHWKSIQKLAIADAQQEYNEVINKFPI
ncbi:hypothetical protein ABES80_07115 [Bacillus gobiensis]